VKKATTLRTLFYAAATLLVTPFLGAIVYYDVKPGKERGTIIFAIIYITSTILVIVLGFMTFISLLTEVFINASGGKFIREKTGSPFHYLLWDELRERIERD